MNTTKLAIKKIKLIANYFGIDIIRYESKSQKAKNFVFDKWETLCEFLIANIGQRSLKVDKSFENQFINFVIKNFRHSHSQLFQDLLVLFLTKEKKQGYFVEFGATNGISFSNTYLLEKKYGWIGVVAEPAKIWHKDLLTNRSCIVDKRCVWGETGAWLSFNQTECAELSTIETLTSKDRLAAARISSDEYKVETISLNDLLVEHDAPKEIDFLSIDTEGSEFAIINAFDFSKHSIKIICVEHNHFEPDRSDIHTLLMNNNFVRIFEQYSQFDDWFINRNYHNE